MLSYDEALERILASTPDPIIASYSSLRLVYGSALAEDIYADIPLPPFDNSAVDGFAVRLQDAANASQTNPVTLQIAQTIKAGDNAQTPVQPGEAARILTGAMVPPHADAIIMVEDTQTDGDSVTLLDAPSPQFIRRMGSDLPVGTLALEACTTLDAGAIGILAALNYQSVRVFLAPTFGILTTGDEINHVEGVPLTPGQIRNANAPALYAAVCEVGGFDLFSEHIGDNLDETRDALRRATKDCDIIIASGGVSVGEYDFVKAAVEAEGGTLDFWRVAIKPGKPLCFGTIGNALFFGLPGNPASSLVTFELFVRPVLRKMAGHKRVTRPQVPVTLATDLEHEPGRREFVRARLEYTDNGLVATPTGLQTSHRLASMVNVDALLVAHEERGDYKAGETLTALLLTAN